MENRDYKNYGGQSTKYLDPLTSKFVTIFEIASRFSLSQTALTVVFEGWKSTDSFDRRQSPIAVCRRDFNKAGDEFEEIKTRYKDIFLLLEEKGLEFLEISSDEYLLESFTIDASNKRIGLTAKHKNKADKQIVEHITTEVDFDSALAAHPELVAAYFGFVWSFGKANDDFLATLEPAD